jgi:hypothetical protein
MGACHSLDGRLLPQDTVRLIVIGEMCTGSRIMYQTQHRADALVRDIKEGHMREAAVGERSFGDLFDAARRGDLAAIHHVGVHCMREHCTFYIPLETILLVLDAVYRHIDACRSPPDLQKPYRKTRYTTIAVDGNITKDSIEDIRRVLCSEEYNCIHFHKKHMPRVFRD